MTAYLKIIILLQIAILVLHALQFRKTFLGSQEVSPISSPTFKKVSATSISTANLEVQDILETDNKQ